MRAITSMNEGSELNERTALFVKLPFTIKDLELVHLCNKRKPYKVEKVVEFTKTAYENFIIDLTVDRWYIENNKNLCFIDEDSLWHCLLIRKRGCQDGVLIMSEGTNYPKFAAWYQG